MAQAKKKKTDPFKTRKTKTPAAQTADTLTPPTEVKKAIDQFRDLQEQARHYEGEATVYKDKVLQFSLDEFCQRTYQGKVGSFKLMGSETMVSYIVQDSSAGLTEDDMADFSERWGENAANELIVRDFASIRFDAKVLEANYEQVVGALHALPSEILDHLFKPMLMKAAPGAVEKAKTFAKNPDELKEMMGQLKIKNYIK